MSKSLRIAITGTIGSGKSTVSQILRNKGYYVFDCDQYNKELLLKDGLGYNEIIKYFDVLDENNNIDKAKLSKIIFNNKEKKEQLEKILHPLILNKMLEESLKHNVFFSEVPLLYETGFDKYFDYTILVYVNDEVAIERLIKRGMSKEDSVLRIKNQLDKEIKKQKADFVIYNNGTLEDLKKVVGELSWN